jgi:hypothetical protein
MACTETPAVTNRPPSAGIEVLSFDLAAGKEWRLMELRGGAGFNRDMMDPEFADTYTLVFKDGAASGRGAPNLYRFLFEAGENQSLSIKPGIATLMAPIFEPEGFRESEYFGYLGRVYRWNLKDGELELFTRTETGEEAVLVYQPAS